jgi:pimeloyl-ACP methyl ester carboxylesterase
MSQPPEANPPLVRGETAILDIAAVSAFVRGRRSLPKCVHLGYSWGTALMGRFAADNASVVERLVLYAPVWLRQTPSLADPGGELGAYRYVTQEAARARRGAGVPEAARASLVPPGWFEHWAGVTWATDPEGLRRNPPALRAPNGSPADSREFWAAGKPLLRSCEDHGADAAGPRRMGPGYAALHGADALSAAHGLAGQAAGAAGRRHAWDVDGAQPRRPLPGGAGVPRGGCCVSSFPDTPTICFAHVVYRSGDRFAERGGPYPSFEVRTLEELQARAGEADVLVCSGFWRNNLPELAPRS